MESQVVSEKADEPDPTGKQVMVKVSWYNPALLGTNCGREQNGICVSKMANGEAWQDWIDKDVIACPFQWDFGTRVEIGGVIYTCKDRGGAIVFDGETYWVDMLVNEPRYPYGTVMEGVVLDD